jgi:hypothetical protein
LYRHIDNVDWKKAFDKYLKIWWNRKKQEIKNEFVNDVTRLRGVKPLQEMDAGFFRLFLVHYSLKNNLLQIFEWDDPNLKFFKSAGLKKEFLNGTVEQQFDIAAKCITNLTSTKMKLENKAAHRKKSSLQELKNNRRQLEKAIELNRGVLDDISYKDDLQISIKQLEKQLEELNLKISNEECYDKLFAETQREIETNSEVSDQLQSILSVWTGEDPIIPLEDLLTTKEHYAHSNIIDHGLIPKELFEDNQPVPWKFKPSERRHRLEIQETLDKFDEVSSK